MRTRGFEVARGYEDAEINLPERQTKHSAGYDFESAEYVTIPSIWKRFAQSLMLELRQQDKVELGRYSGGGITARFNVVESFKNAFKPTLVSTGVKAYMNENEALFLYNRSSNPLKRFLLMSNGVGVIDADYYNNEDNDGHIMFQFINLGLTDMQINKGERIGQGVFKQYLIADNDTATRKRSGGFGSTNESI